MEQVLALLFTGAAMFRVRGGVALGVPGGAKQVHQLFIFVWDEVAERSLSNTERIEVGEASRSALCCRRRVALNV